ncbi:RHS repeat-associated core domain-containing protein, partial [Caballeronia sp. LZ035]|uniref:RHS repeat-associated core domain-containing protein n=1 Tax=Caballeronia sp. LZ035 TaxID=3038568 RepID=UPI0028561F32
WIETRKVEQAIRLQGQYYDPESNLHYNRYRYFDSGTGQFISQDPIGLEGGLNPYAFAPNSLAWSDPLGLKCGGIFSKLKDALGKAWDKIRGVFSKSWSIPKSVTGKFPEGWVKSANKKKDGFRWHDPSNKGNGVRIDKGSPGHPLPAQQVDHVIVRSNGRVIGRDGNPIAGSIKNDPVNAHIPLSDYKKWKTWNAQ